MDQFQWKLSFENPFVRGVAFLAAFATLVLSAHVVALAAYLVLLWSLVLFFRVQAQQVFPLWILYSFVYWSHGIGKEDSNVLLAFVRSIKSLFVFRNLTFCNKTTLCHAAAIVMNKTARELIGNNQWVVVVFGAILMLPTQCNNLYYTPVFSIVRIVLYIAVEQAEPRGSWLVKQVRHSSARNIRF